MAKARPLGSNGYVTATVGTDIILEMTSGEGWSLVPSKYFWIYAKDTVEISVNGLSSFTLLPEDTWKSNDSVLSVIILTADAEFRYTAEF